ncbi:MAG: methyltransferase domain-containing protein [Euryarchaeota archaeon]|nr:methyltransferase domain-containing protein [Euryarchaeota archaeon]
MFSYVYMKVLETVPRRYDLGINLLSLGMVGKVKGDMASMVEEGDRVLDMGCGTGTLAVLMADRGAKVTGIISTAMLEVAIEKAAARGLNDRIEFREMGVAEMDSLEDGSFDKVTATLVFSELSRDEQEYALREAHRLLKDGGLLIIADEVVPEIDSCCLSCLLLSALKKTFYHLTRIPLLILTFVLTQTSTRPVKGLKEKMREAGFRIISTKRAFSLETVIAEKEGLIRPSEP